MSLLLLLVIIIVLFGGWGYGTYYGNWGPNAHWLLGLILIIVILKLLNII